MNTSARLPFWGIHSSSHGFVFPPLVVPSNLFSCFFDIDFAANIRFFVRCSHCQTTSDGPYRRDPIRVFADGSLANFRLAQYGTNINSPCVVFDPHPHAAHVWHVFSELLPPLVGTGECQDQLSYCLLFLDFLT